MPDKRPPFLAGLPHLARQQFEELPGRCRQWRGQLREDPGLLWRSPVVRIMGVILLIVLMLMALNWAIGALTPGGSGPLGERATPVATLYVACSDPACHAEFATQQPMDFKAWPLKCPKCGRMTVYRAARCPACRHWIAAAPGTASPCPFCAEKATAQPSKRPVQHMGPRTDDDEDPWSP